MLGLNDSRLTEPSHSIITPYVGLTPYYEEDAPFFFGRERERTLIIANLLASRLTLLYGPSGVGKSSVLHAGVISHLNKLASNQKTRDGIPNHVVAMYNSWSEDHVTGLREAVHSAVTRSLPGRKVKPFDPDRSLTATLQDLTNPVIDEPSARLTILIILDQFEEFFLYSQDQHDGSLATELPEILNQPNLRANVLLSLREDYLASLDRFKGRINYLFDNCLRIRHLSREAASDAINRPVDEYNRLFGNGKPISIDPELVQTVLEEVKINEVTLGETGRGILQPQVNDKDHSTLIETPYLQLVMSRIWQTERAAGSNILRLSTLQRLKGSKNIVKTHVDAVMENLSSEERDIAARVFHYLVTPSGTKIAYLPFDLANLTGLDQPALTAALKTLSGGGVRLLTTVEPPLNRPDEPRYEIRHDALAPAILDWRSRFMAAKESAANLEKLVSERQRVRRLRLMLAGALLLLLMMVALAVYAYSLRSRALLQQNIAFSRELAANAVAEGLDPELAVLLAREAVKTNRTEQADDALRKTLLHVPLQRILRGHQNWVNAAVFSRDGRFVVTRSGDGTARVWTLATGEYVELKGHENAVSDASFSPDGRLVVTASYDKTVRVWDSQSGRMIAVMNEHQDVVKSAEFSPDGQKVVTASGDGYVRIWEALTGHLVLSLNEGPAFRGQDFSVTDAKYSEDGKFIVAACRDDMARVWDAMNGKLKRKLPHGSMVYTGAFSRDGKYIVTASQDDTARVWDAETGTMVGEVLHGSSVYDAKFSPDGNLIATASRDDTGRVWDWRNNSSKVLRHAHSEEGVLHINFSPDGKFVVTAGDDGLAIVWNAISGGQVAELKGHNDFVRDAVFSPDGRSIITASGDKTARLWNAPSDQEVRLLQTNRGPLDHVYFSPNSRYAAVSGTSFGAQIWDTYKSMKIADISESGLTSLSFTPEGDLVLGVTDSMVIVWDTLTGTQVTNLRSPTAKAAVLSPNRQFVVVVQDGGVAQLWSTNSTNTIPLVGHSTDSIVRCAAFSPGSNYVATGSGDNTIRMWDVSTGSTVAVLTGHGAEVTGIAFSPDGKTLVSGSEDNTARVWDSETHKTIFELKGHQQPLTKVEFSFDGKYVLTASLDGTARVWDVASGKSLAVLGGGKNLKSATFSRDARTVITVGEANFARAWDWEHIDSTSPTTLLGPGDLTTDAAFSPDGRFLIVGSGDGIARVYPWERFAPIEDLLKVVAQRVTRDLSQDERRRYLHEP